MSYIFKNVLRSVWKTLRKSLLLRIGSIIRFLIVGASLFLLSGSLLSLTSPLPPGMVFTRGLNYQSIPETILFFIMITILFLGVYLMKKGLEKIRIDYVTFTIGFLLFISTLFITLFIMVEIKGIRILS